ncbi:Lrp/AsnC family transcriptional regulator [Brevibacterium sp. UCMA 11754]|uniref:Lrp/AsnC family transcriptional regulator n=1 Tax=Brevibacterium sp. UCMA 11754 TaxID=2749198 RepID=UPI001F263E93|nr:Lrp/AsnC family transcriptional regulator [Brevibacterium sp. UCMA 11754]MCF2570872.1 Lrp/AsnC family transcriptional regulator [Brevibacterium sp. UCMA 11754]
MSTSNLNRTPRPLNDLDQGIVRALHDNGRAAWSSIAAETNSSTSTVRRRFEALNRDGRLRVTGRVDVTRLGLAVPVMVQFRGRDSSRPDFLQSLQVRSDVRYVGAVAGSAGCVAEIVMPSLVDIQGVIHEITLAFDVSAELFVATHTYTSGQDWLPATVNREIDVRQERLEAKLTREESTVLGLLLKDGRTSLSDLAAPIEKSESTARRILESLISREIVSFRVLVEPELLGFQSSFWAWLNVEPSHLTAIGTELAAMKETKTLFATAGRYNLVGQFVLKFHTDMHAFMTDVLGSIAGIKASEIMMQTSTHKRVWNMVKNSSYIGVSGPGWLFESSMPMHARQKSNQTPLAGKDSGVD